MKRYTLETFTTQWARIVHRSRSIAEYEREIKAAFGSAVVRDGGIDTPAMTFATDEQLASEARDIIGRRASDSYGKSLRRDRDRMTREREQSRRSFDAWLTKYNAALVRAQNGAAFGDFRKARRLARLAAGPAPMEGAHL